jgi:hypothetical protein
MHHRTARVRDTRQRRVVGRATDLPQSNQTPDIDPPDAPLNFNAVPQEMQIPRCAFLMK